MAALNNEVTPLVGASENRPDSKRVRLVTVAACSLAILLFAAFGFPRVTTDVQQRESRFCDPDVKHDIGYIELPNKVDTHFFFWYFESRSAHPETDPLVLWLSGGGSSISAALAENGPCRVYPDLTTEPNAYSWNSEANVIWLDQPTGQGFSYGPSEDTDHNSTQAADNVYWFLHEFLNERHPELQGREFFVMGESYAGHYIPVTAHHIWKKNQAASDNSSNASNAITTPLINLQGIAIGNGLVNPAVQYAHVVDMVDNSYNISTLSKTQIQAMRDGAPKCIELVHRCQDTFVANGNMLTCLATYPCWNETLYLPFMSTKLNIYDLRLPCLVPLECYDFSTVVSFLNSDYMYELMGVSRERVPVWSSLNMTITKLFIESGDWALNFDPYIADLLDADFRVLIYAGDADMLSNWLGANAWTEALEWKGQQGFNDAEELAFWDSKAASVVSSIESGGLLRQFKNLAFLRVFNAGHMVPMDQPELSLAMLSRFLKNEL